MTIFYSYGILYVIYFLIQIFYEKNETEAIHFVKSEDPEIMRQQGKDFFKKALSIHLLISICNLIWLITGIVTLKLFWLIPLIFFIPLQLILQNTTKISPALICYGSYILRIVIVGMVYYQHFY